MYQAVEGGDTVQAVPVASGNDMVPSSLLVVQQDIAGRSL